MGDPKQDNLTVQLILRVKMALLWIQRKKRATNNPREDWEYLS